MDRRQPRHPRWPLTGGEFLARPQHHLVAMRAIRLMGPEATVRQALVFQPRRLLPASGGR
jgi:hypothetical protein